MKYVNANDVLPEELLSMIQKYYQGGYLYIPKENFYEVRQQTDYKIELEKRNQHIYLKHLEGRTNGQLGNIYHLSEASIRRIISKEKVRYQKMKEIIEQILPLWGIENKRLLQIYPSAWEINDSYVIKVYDDKKQLERNIKISEILLDCAILVAKTVLTKTGEKYVEYKNSYFLMSKELQGSNISDIKDKTIAWKMGCAIAQLHTAFARCEKEVEFWDNSLLKEMKGWIRENLANNEWKILNEEEYTKTVEMLESVYDYLPKQLIHRDVHFGNFLFFEGNLSGYIDFDLSQRNIRIFDICYFLTGLLAEETDDAFTKMEWIENAKAVIAGYESIINLSEKEKNAIPCVMECIEILFVAYFISMNDIKHANDAYKVFRFIQSCESDIKN
ncbi:MAG: phosphotransferase [Roseburia sp.]|nr:phosphotransferase [Roseburia sp.]